MSQTKHQHQKWSEPEPEEEVDGGGGHGDHCNDQGNKLIAKYAIERKMKDGPISKLLIIKTGHTPTQYKEITDTLPILCADKNF